MPGGFVVSLSAVSGFVVRPGVAAAVSVCLCFAVALLFLCEAGR